MRFKAFSPYLLILIFATLLFWTIFVFPDKTIIKGDAIKGSAFTYEFEHNSYNKFGTIPHWNPTIFTGSIMDPELGRYYPVHWIFLFFYDEILFNGYFFLHVILAGIGMFLFLRLLKLNQFPALIGSLIFMLSGPILIRIGHHTAHIAALSLMPLIFYLFELTCNKKELKYSLYLGLALAAQLLAGHQQYFVYSSLLLGAYGVFKLAQIPQKEWKKKFPFLFLLFGIAIITCLLLSSIDILPKLEFTAHLNRLHFKDNEGSSFEYVSSGGSYGWKELILFVMPHFLGSPESWYWGAPTYNELFSYMGILTLIFACLSIFYYKKRKKESLFFLGLGVLALLGSMGQQTPVFQALYRIIPVLSMFRAPSRMIIITIFSLSVLAAFGTQFLFSINHKKPEVKKFYTLMGVGSVLLFLTLLVVVFSKEQILRIGEGILRGMYFNTYQNTIFVQKFSFEQLTEKIVLVYSSMKFSILYLTIILSVCTFFLHAWYNQKINRKTIKIIILLILVGDVLYFSLPTISGQDSKDIFRATPVVEYLQQDISVYRVFDLNQELLPQQIASRYGIQKFGGRYLTRLKYYDTFVTDAVNLTDTAHRNLKWWGRLEVSQEYITNTYTAKLLGMMNVKYILSPYRFEHKGENMDDYEFIDLFDDTYVYENKAVLPRAYIVRKVETITQPKQLFFLMQQDGFNPKQTAFIEENADFYFEQGPFIEIPITFYSPNKVDFSVTLEKPGFLVFSDAWYPNWKAYDNGQEIKVYKTNYLVRGVYLPAGQHQIEFMYQSTAIELGKYISIISILIIILTLLSIELKKSKSAHSIS